MKLLLVGSTGLVGGQVLKLALADPRVTGVVALTRRPLAEHPKLSAPIVDYGHLPESELWWQADAVICTLGTTLRVAGSQEAFYRVDHDYPLAVARLARQHGTPTYVLNSSVGADPSSRFFYTRVKGEVERDLQTLGFSSLTLVRPGVIGGQRAEFRLGERVALVFLSWFGPILPRSWRLSPADHIAKALLEAALRAEPGVRIVPPEELA